MPKFYVQSGTLQLVTTATDPRAAAIWAVHRALAPTLPFLNHADSAPAPRSSPHAQLGEVIVVSEQGFASLDDIQFETLTIAAEWTQLLVVVDRLQRRLTAI